MMSHGARTGQQQQQMDLGSVNNMMANNTGAASIGCSMSNNPFATREEGEGMMRASAYREEEEDDDEDLRELFSQGSEELF